MALNYPSDNIIACNHTKKCLFPKSLYTLHFAVSTQFVDICVVIQKVGTTCILFYFSILNIVHKSLPSILTGPESLENFGTQSYYEIKTCSHCFVLWQYKKKNYMPTSFELHGSSMPKRFTCTYYCSRRN